MTKLFFILQCVLYFSCHPIEEQRTYNEVSARVTYYWNDPITSTGVKPKQGLTIAVDPKIIPYGTEVYIPKMKKTFVAQDTGSHVKSRLASKKQGREDIVIDVYCDTKNEAQKKIKKYPMFMKIQILKK